MVYKHRVEGAVWEVFLKIPFGNSLEGKALVFQVETGEKGHPNWERACAPGRGSERAGVLCMFWRRGWNSLQEAAEAGRPLCRRSHFCVIPRSLDSIQRATGRLWGSSHLGMG